MAITIRKYKNSDKKQLIDIMNKFQGYLVTIDDMKRTRRLPKYGIEYVKETLKEIKENHGILYVTENEEKKIVGIVAGIIVKPTRISNLETVPSKVGRITEIYLEPDYRRKQFGKLLMDTIESYFKQKKCTVILVEVFAPNRNAYEFYQRCGYIDRDYNLIKVL